MCVCTTVSIQPTTPPPPLYAHLKPLTLHMIYFFLDPRNLDIIRYTKLTLFFILPAPPPSRKKIVHYDQSKLISTFLP